MKCDVELAKPQGNRKSLIVETSYRVMKKKKSGSNLQGYPCDLLQALGCR